MRWLWTRENAANAIVARTIPTPPESATIHYAQKRVLLEIREARQIICGVRVSNETQHALASLERTRRELDEFIRRED